MDKVRRIIVRHHVFEGLIATVLFVPLYLGLTRLWGVPGTNAMWTIIWVIVLVLAYYEKRNKVQYWIRPEYRDLAVQTLREQGFEQVAADGNRQLYARRLWFGRRYFAFETDYSTHLVLDVPEKFEPALDAQITTEMLSGGKRLVGRRLFRRAKA